MNSPVFPILPASDQVHNALELMMTKTKNLFAELPTRLPEEYVEILTENRQLRIERIVSTGQATPEGTWLDQEQAEWVVLLMGQAILLFDGEAESILITPGDFVYIPAHKRHRVEWTTPDEPTVWLAVHYFE
jgi:cupin 2 domain-containing protein